jgi:hypothetical protein
MKSRFLLIMLGFILAGCAVKSLPPVTEVEGTLVYQGKALPGAYIEFYHERDDAGAELNSTAVTDNLGRFKLVCRYQQQPGAIVGLHRVVVTEGPPPADARGMDAQSQQRLAEHMNRLGNRKIPDHYGNYSQTPLRVQVVPEQKAYVITMN